MAHAAAAPALLHFIAAGPAGLDAASRLAERALVIAMELALPVLAVGLIVGLVVGLIQAVTQVQEQTLSSIPKILAMAATLFLLMPWFLGVLSTYMGEMLGGLARHGLP